MRARPAIVSNAHVGFCQIGKYSASPRSRVATGLAGLNAGRHKRVTLDRAIMTRVIKGFAVGWDDRWRRTVWAQREHIYWFKISDGSCIRLWPEHRNHVWSYDFVADRTHDGRKYRMLNVLDEFTHECLAIRVARKLKAIDVLGFLSDLFILRGIPAHIRSDNGPEFVAKAVQEWIAAVGAKTAYIERGSPWENGHIESFNARLRDELLNGEIFYTLREAQIVIESWRRHYNTIRPHASLGYKPPAPEVFIPALAAW